MSHAWASLLSCLPALFYSILVCSRQRRNRGLMASKHTPLQPHPDEIVFHSDGVLIMTVMNTRPYTVELEWVEIAPLVDEENTIRTNINSVISQGDAATYNVNGSNILPPAEASVLAIPLSSAANTTVSVHMCVSLLFSARGSNHQQIFCEEAIKIAYIIEHYVGGGGGISTCFDPLGVCPCEDVGDCPLSNCRSSCVIGQCEDGCYNHPDELCGPLPDPLCSYCACVPTAGEPLGECKLFWHSDC